MADIADELNAISTSIYGREMRGAIHDALETVNNDNENIHDELAQIENIFAVNEEQDADESLNTTKCIFSNGIFTRDVDVNYRCKIYHGLNIADNTWVFDTYCADVSVPVAILCVNATSELLRYCVPIYAERVGAINKTIPITKEGTGYPSDTCTIVINSYQNIPTLYKHEVELLNVYTKDETDAAIANAINSAINSVINTAY